MLLAWERQCFSLLRANRTRAKVGFDAKDCRCSRVAAPRPVRQEIRHKVALYSRRTDCDLERFWEKCLLRRVFLVSVVQNRLSNSAVKRPPRHSDITPEQTLVINGNFCFVFNTKSPNRLTCSEPTGAGPNGAIFPIFHCVDEISGCVSSIE